MLAPKPDIPTLNSFLLDPKSESCSIALRVNTEGQEEFVSNLGKGEAYFSHFLVNFCKLVTLIFTLRRKHSILVITSTLLTGRQFSRSLHLPPGSLIGR